LNIYGGTITGYCAIGISNGTLNISGGTITGTADDNELADTYNTDGLVSDGSAIVLASSYGDVVVNITGGTIESYYSYAIRAYYRTNSTTTSAVSISGSAVVKSATANAATAVTSDIYIPSTYSDHISASISGGTFSTAVKSEYCADGYTPTENTDDDGNVTSYTVEKFYLGASTDTTESTSVPAESIDGYGESIMYVKVSSDYIGTTGYYSTDNYPTTSLTFDETVTTTDEDSGETTSTTTIHNYIFAGWYSATTAEDGTVTYSAMSSFPTGDAYAKFVDADILLSGVQLTAGATSADDTTNVRFLSTVDTTDYASVGFVITVSGYYPISPSSSTVYTSITGASGETIVTYPPTVFSSSSSYFITYTLRNVTKNAFDTNITVQAYWVTLDGTTVYGTVKEFTVNDYTTKVEEQ